jgi:hypothetical protein
MWEKALKAHFRKKLHQLIAKGTPPKEIDSLIQDMLGMKTDRDA